MMAEKLADHIRGKQVHSASTAPFYRAPRVMAIFLRLLHQGI